MNTTAYQRRRAEFQDLIYQDYRRSGSQAGASSGLVPTGVQEGLGVKLAAVYRISEQGPVHPTGNAFDLAIQGNGFFEVTMPDGTSGYTRDGTLQIDNTGALVTHDGYPVQPAITVPTNATSVTISPDGTVFASISGATAASNLGQLQVVTFANEAGLHAEGQNILTETSASGAPIVNVPGTNASGSILQGFVESSNVNPVTEITALISAQRAYEMNSKSITTASEMLSKVAQIR